MGVRFSVNGETHYGWIRLKVPNILLSVTEIISYAYETTPDTPIIAGQISGNDALGSALPKIRKFPNPPLSVVWRKGRKGSRLGESVKQKLSHYFI
jgi:hypothetical protein